MAILKIMNNNSPLRYTTLFRRSQGPSTISENDKLRDKNGEASKEFDTLMIFICVERHMKK